MAIDHPLVRRIALTCIAAVALAGSAGAQAPRPSRAAAAAAVPKACKPEIERFCTEVGATAAPQPRTAALCLKPFKSSLSLSCRRAVRAVFP